MMEKEEKPLLLAEYKKGKIEVSDTVYSSLSASGYGKRENKTFVLEFYEAMYLVETGKLRVLNEDGKELKFHELAEIAQKAQNDAWTKYIVYRDLRTRGYVVREGFGIGTDLRVYDRGEYPDKPAKYVVFALDEGMEKNVEDIRKYVREIAVMGKEAIIAVLERRGEVIYYRVSEARF
jgi:tRNA-intron endonuclease